MIRSIRMCINHSSKIRTLDLDNPRLQFEPGYNVLIGPNGAGKSTTLDAIASCPMCKADKAGPDGGIKYITTETLNPLSGGSFATREKMVQAIRSMFRSHGQGVLDSLGNQYQASEIAVLIDSPETGQDHERCVLIHEGLLKMSRHVQVIIATNSLIFMRGGNLIDLGNKTLPRLIKATEKLVAGFDSTVSK
ncbi:MAG: AAA family ATPase [Candidatus Hydrogenedentes bacterium]|nr:AAA family ATPase [Candidatus Hydrogenedentota bacterium]